MAGLRDLFRGRSKSRGRNKEKAPAPDASEQAPPVPPIPEEAKAQEAKAPEPEAGQAPLPLMRPDSVYHKEPPPPPAENAGDPYTYTNAKGEQRGASFSYESFTEGEAPHQGTLPLHGNAPSRISSLAPQRSVRNSKSVDGRSPSTASTNRRPESMVRSPSVNRRSIPPGTAISTDEPITRTYSFNSHSSAPPEKVTRHERQATTSSTRNVYSDTTPGKVAPVNIGDGKPVQTVVHEYQKDKGPSQLDNLPASPVVTGPYKTNGAVAAPAPAPSVPTSPTQTRHERVVSSSSKASKASTTPIADEQRESHSQSSNPPPLRHQPDVPDLSSRIDRNLPSSSSAAAQNTATSVSPPSSRGRPSRRSYDRPIPKELRNAPWNRPENAAYTLPPDDDDPHLTATQASSYSTNLSSASAIPSSSTPMNSAPTQASSNYSDVRSGPQTIYSGQPVAQETQKPSLDGIVDLRNTEDTTVQRRWAPAVQHETVKPTLHHVREEQITREFHTHDVHHRVLPIVDVQVLPAKHYVPTPDGSTYVEVPAESIPGRAVDRNTPKNWVIAETVSRIPSGQLASTQQVQQPRKFTARTFDAEEGDKEEWVGEDGVKRTKQTWIHPPTVAQDPINKGITKPLYIDASSAATSSSPQPTAVKESSSQAQPPTLASVPPEIPARMSSKRQSDARPLSQPNGLPSTEAEAEVSEKGPTPAEPGALIAAKEAIENSLTQDSATSNSKTQSTQGGALVAAQSALTNRT